MSSKVTRREEIASRRASGVQVVVRLQAPPPSTHEHELSRPPILCSCKSECCACRYGSGCPGSPFSNPRAFGGPDGVTFLAAAAAAPPEQPAQPRVEEEEAVKEEEAVWVGAS